MDEFDGVLNMNAQRICLSEGHVLQGLKKSDLLSGRYDMYRILLTLPLPDVDSAWFFVEKAMVKPYYLDAKQPEAVLYEAYLVHQDYNVTYLDTSGIEHVIWIRSDELVDLYYRAKPAVLPSGCCLMSVPITCIGFYDDLRRYREVSFISSRIRMGAYLTFFVSNMDIHWVPKQIQIESHNFREICQMESFADIVLSDSTYDVRYKDANTCWKYQTETVSASELAQDYLLSTRAASMNLPIGVYLQERMDRRKAVGLDT